jgi:hypothetical protein
MISQILFDFYFHLSDFKEVASLIQGYPRLNFTNIATILYPGLLEGETYFLDDSIFDQTRRI